MTRAKPSDERLTAGKAVGTDLRASVETLNSRRQAREAGETALRRQIPAEDLDLIVRRAAEIQNKHGDPGSQLLTEEEVVEIGRQVGLQPDYVRRAMAEVRAESLAPKRPPGNRVLDLVAGDSRVEIRRVVAGNPTRVQQQIESQLRNGEKLTALRRRPMRSVWEASSGAMDRLERFMNFSGKEYALAETRQVEFAVAEVEPGWSLVTLAADIGNKRDEALYGTAAGVAVIAIFSAIFSGEELGYGVAAVIGITLLAGLASAAVAIPWVRWVLDKRRARIELMLESLVDEVDR